MTTARTVHQSPPIPVEHKHPNPSATTGQRDTTGQPDTTDPAHADTEPPLSAPAPSLEERKQAALAAIVKLQGAGMGNYQIAEVLSLAGIRTPAKGHHWTGQRVYLFLQAEHVAAQKEAVPPAHMPRPARPLYEAPTIDPAGAEHVAAQKAKRRASGK